MERELGEKQNTVVLLPGSGVLHKASECACTGRGAESGASLESRLETVLSRYAQDAGALLSLLEDVQSEFGYLSHECLAAIARHAGVAEGKVFGVATFYNQFRFTPPGKHPIKVCMGTACHMAGGKLVIDALERELDIKVGGLTSDGEYSLERVACVGCCALAPVMEVGKEVHPHMTGFKAEEILAGWKRETPSEAARDIREAA